MSSSAPRGPHSTIALRPDVFADVPRVVAGFSTRHGGVSEAPYDSLNLSRHVGDDPDAVAENRRRFCAALGMEPDRLATARQVHADTVHTVRNPGEVADCDALVTDTPNLLLAITAADCAVVLLADPAARVVGACHAGWRGAVAAIVPKAIEQMQSLGAQSSRMRAYISPCIHRAAFEVGPEVADQFDAAVVHRRDEWAKPHVDLPNALRRQLADAGVPHVETADRCTVQNDAFFSYRRDGDPMGCMFGAIALR